jgi:OmpA-OmpF porin, OOP family
MRSTPALALFAGIAAPILFASTTASAQQIPSANGDGIDTHLFRPAFDSRGIISVNGVDVVEANKVSLGLTLDYGRGLLRARDGQDNVALVRNSFTGTFIFNYGIANRAVVGVSAPAILMSGDAHANVPGWGTGMLDAQSIGHVALHGKLKLTRASSALGIAAAVQVGVPISDAPRNAGGDPGVWYWPMMIFEKRFGDDERFRIAANVGYRGHSASGTALDLRDGRVKDGSRITYGAGVSFRVFDPLDLVAETYGTYLLGVDSSGAVKPSNEAIGGIKLFVDKSSHLTIGAGPRYTSGFEAADFRGVVAFVFEPPALDSDGDGVPDSEDHCPTTFGIRSSDATQNGCPLDTDGDGIPDVEDACPYVKGPRTNDPRTNGCPPIPDRTPELPDRDKDGIPDVYDACPDLPGDPHPEDPKRHGCPDVIVGPDDITVFDKILFKTASAEILPESNPILDKVAKAINAHPELLMIEVAGHADERGGEQYKVTLTQARVESVVIALAARNVERSRLRAKGYGYYCPRADGHDEEAWGKNRRVEFVIVKTTKGVSDSKLGCENAKQHGITPAPPP